MSFPCSSRGGRCSTAVALSAALAAAAATIGADRHRSAPAAEIVPSAAKTTATAPAVSSPAINQADLIRMFNAGLPAPMGDTFQLATYQEHQVELGQPSEIRQVLVRNVCGDVLVVHTPKEQVAVVAGKVAAAGQYDQAREYAKKLNFTLRRDGERVMVQLSQPAQPPAGIWSSVRCLVLAPRSVRVTIVGGQPQQ